MKKVYDTTSTFATLMSSTFNRSIPYTELAEMNHGITFESLTYDVGMLEKKVQLINVDITMQSTCAKISLSSLD